MKVSFLESWELESKVLIERSRQVYNTVRPHRAPGYRAPASGVRQPIVSVSSPPLANEPPSRGGGGEKVADVESGGYSLRVWRMA